MEKSHQEAVKEYRKKNEHLSFQEVLDLLGKQQTLCETTEGQEHEAAFATLCLITDTLYVKPTTSLREALEKLKVFLENEVGHLEGIHYEALQSLKESLSDFVPYEAEETLFSKPVTPNMNPLDGKLKFGCINEAYATLMQQENVLCDILDKEENLETRAEMLYPEWPECLTINSLSQNTVTRMTLEDVERQFQAHAKFDRDGAIKRRNKQLSAHKVYKESVAKINATIGLSKAKERADAEIAKRNRLVNKVLSFEIQSEADIRVWFKVASKFGDANEHIDKYLKQPVKGHNTEPQTFKANKQTDLSLQDQTLHTSKDVSFKTSNLLNAEDALTEGITAVRSIMMLDLSSMEDEQIIKFTASTGLKRLKDAQQLLYAGRYELMTDVQKALHDKTSKIAA